MVTPTENTRRIARNTLMLYIRMFILMAVTLYTSRVVLNVLGVEDYGIYELVGGIVVFFSVLNVAMATATQRFLSYELGKGDTEGLDRIFGVSKTTHALIAIAVLVLAETIGLWFINSQLSIPPDRMPAANWVYQLSVISACINILRVPYGAAVISHERMSFYSILGIGEALLRLGMAGLLVLSGYDKLITYSLLLTVISVIIYFAYRVYSSRNFACSRQGYRYERGTFMQLMGFSGWSLFGNVANVTSYQGTSIIFNILRGLPLNAALGIANQLSLALYAFVNNFQIAFNPQIVKSYASQDTDYLRSLIIRSSKFSLLLMLVIALPIMVKTEAVLIFWLGKAPEYTVGFIRLLLLFFMVDALSGPLWMLVQAKGNIRRYQLVVGSMVLLNIPLAFLLLYWGESPITVLAVKFIINSLTFVYRIYYLRGTKGFSPGLYIKKAVLPSVAVGLISLIAVYYAATILPDTISGIAVTLLVSVLVTGTSGYFFGMGTLEKQYVRSIIKKYITGKR